MIAGRVGCGVVLALVANTAYAEDKDAQTLQAPLTLSKFAWTAGSAPVTLPPVATHICLIQGVSGKFAGASEQVMLTIDKAAPGGPRFMLKGKSGQQQLRIDVGCVPRAQLAPVDPWQVTAMEKIYSPNVTSTGCTENRAPVLEKLGDYAFFLAAMGGSFRGAGEKVQATTYSGKAAAGVSACSGYVTGGILSISGSGGRMVKYRTAAGVTVDPDAATFRQRGAPAGYMNNKIDMTQTADSFCGLVGVSGKFNGYGEWVNVTWTGTFGKPGSMWRMVAVTSSQDSPFVEGAARCYARDQR